MQSEKETSGNEGKRNIGGLTCLLMVIWIIAQIVAAFFDWPEWLLREQGLRSVAMHILGFLMMLSFAVVIIKDGIDKTKHQRTLKIVALVVDVIVWLTIPFFLQGVYRGTNENIVETEKTYVVSTQVIYINEGGAEQPIQVETENDAILVHFEQNAQPYVEVVQYCTTLTTDNQNPWGRKTTETIKEWTQYEFHLPASEVSN